jgi:HTH-type transcriptional regulator/antitoxin MqsA
MEKRTPHCKLSVVKALIEAGRVRTTRAAQVGANELGMGVGDMLKVVKALTPSDFYKSITTHADHTIWQDVYRPLTQAGGATELIHDTRDQPYTYKGETTVITAVTGDFCPACTEYVLDLSESDRVMREMSAFSKQVNASIVDPDFIASVRKKLALDQREAAEIFGGGVNAFSRYENGKTKPSLALVKLLKVLDRHPELLSEIRTA